MKTLELDLKKKVFIVDTNAPIEAIEIDDYEFFCKGSELTEEIASELCHNIGNCLTIEGNAFLDDENDEEYFEFAKEAVISSVERKKFHWLNNPIKIIERGEDTEHNRVLNQNEWQEFEEKTFRNPLIFVKK